MEFSIKTFLVYANLMIFSMAAWYVLVQLILTLIWQTYWH